MAKVKKAKSNWKSFFVPAVLILGLIVAVVLIANPSFRTSGAWDCSKYNIAVSQKGLVTVDNGSAYAEPRTGVDVYINDVKVSTLQAPALAPGQKAEIGSVTVPNNGIFTWVASAVADRNCTDRGSYDEAIACRNLITFSSVPSQDSPTDNQIILNQYAAQYGVTFSMKKPPVAVPSDVCQPRNGPRLAKEGAPWTAFEGVKKNGTTYDNMATEEPGNATMWFLTDNGVVSPAISPNSKYACTIRLDYQAGFRGKGVQFDLIDIDGGENYVINAFNAEGKRLTSVPVGKGLSLNAKAQKINVYATEDIAALEILPQGSRGDGAGWGMAVDNFCVNDGADMKK